MRTVYYLVYLRYYLGDIYCISCCRKTSRNIFVKFSKACKPFLNFYFVQVIRNCNDAILIESNNAKALFRRAQAYEAKKEWEKAIADLKLAQIAAPEDAAIGKSEERIRRQILKEKEKDKKIWGKAFSSAK